MNTTNEPMPAFLTGEPSIGDEIHVTGKWTARTTRRHGRSEDGTALAETWNTIADQAPSSVSVEVNPGVGQDAVLLHVVATDADELIAFFGAAMAEHGSTLNRIAEPELHLLRAVRVTDAIVDALTATGAPVGVGEWAFGHERTDHPIDPAQAIQVTAIWAGTADGTLAELEYWWQRVATEANTLEPGLVRFEAYRVPGEQALLIHETFADTKTLKFHLTKGTAAMFKKELDAIAAPRNYYFRGPVSWMIRTYSKFMKLPATYSER